jgi:hypothetical protein
LNDHSAQYLEDVINIEILFSTGLKKGNFEALSQRMPFLKRYHPLHLIDICLVTHQHLGNWLFVLLINLIDPFGDVIKATTIGY